MPHYARTTVCAVAATALIALTACSPEQEQAAEREQPTSASGTPVGCGGPTAAAYAGAPTAYGSPVRVEEGRALSAQVDAPTLTTRPAGVAGWSVVEVPVKASVVTNGVFGVGPESFVLIDEQGRQCGHPNNNPLGEPLRATQVDERRPASGSVAFLVPQGAPLSRYKVLYNGKGNVVEGAWAVGGGKSVTATPKTCSSTRSAFRPTGGAPSARFGRAVSVGDASTVGSLVWAGAPTYRSLPAGEKQPNDVTGIAVTVQVRSYGASTFVDRHMFQLVDGSGTVCRYSQTGSAGETLTSDLVPAGQLKSYTLIFWTPKGTKIKDWTLHYRQDTGSSWTNATWGWAPKG